MFQISRLILPKVRNSKGKYKLQYNNTTISPFISRSYAISKSIIECNIFFSLNSMHFKLSIIQYPIIKKTDQFLTPDSV